MAANNQKIVLGSGKVYVTEFTGAIPEDSAIEVEENLLGLISGGASLEYTPEAYTAVDDLGLVKKSVLTNETVLFKTGVMTWNGKTLEKLCATSRVIEDATKKIRTVKMGGVSNQSGKKYLVRFVHSDAEAGTLRISVVGNNQTGFAMAFAKDAETVVNAEFTAVPMDSEGTLIIYTEEIKA